MKNKATHIGTCQLCGCTQMLPNGRLAKHGYTVEYGWGFSGTCSGSGQLPFETSKDFVTKMVLDMEKSIASFVPAVVPSIDMDLVRRSNRRPCDLTAEEMEQVSVRRRAIEHNNQQKLRQSFVAFQTPRLEKWSAQPLKERAAEESVAETKKAANRGIREAARTRDDAKRAWSKAIDRLRRVAGEYANRPFQASRNDAGHANHALYVDFPYEATNTSAKITAMARQHCQNAPEIVAMANEVDALLAAFKAAKDAHAALKNA
jgi:muconolactone delta-isomerase